VPDTSIVAVNFTDVAKDLWMPPCFNMRDQDLAGQLNPNKTICITLSIFSGKYLIERKPVAAVKTLRWGLLFAFI
jgi:hypothetical protein